MTMRSAVVGLVGAAVGGAGVVLAQEPTDVTQLDLGNPVVVVGIAILAVRAAIDLSTKALSLARNGRTSTPLGIVGHSEIEQLRQTVDRGFTDMKTEIQKLDETHRHDRDQVWKAVTAVKSDVDVMKGRQEATR